MPVMDGLEASAKIAEFNATVPIVALTANIMPHDRELYKMNGIQDCVGKPFTSQELWRCLLKYFKPVRWQAIDETQQAQAADELRQKLINNFVKENRNKFSMIVEAIDSGDIKLAHRLAHSLKGNAGQIGETSLQKTAADIEQGLAEGLPIGPEEHHGDHTCSLSGKDLVTPGQMAALEKELNAVLAEYIPLVSEPIRPGAASQAEPLDAESTRELLEKLETMLEMGSPECRGLTGDLCRIPGSEELIRKIENFDFEPAMTSLTELKKKLG